MKEIVHRVEAPTYFVIFTVYVDVLEWHLALRVSGSLWWHSSKWVYRFNRAIQYISGPKLFACSIDTKFKYHDYYDLTVSFIWIFFLDNKSLPQGLNPDGKDDDDNDKELFLWYGWLTKSVWLYFQSGPLLDILTIANLWHAANRIWTCTEPEFSLCWMKLCSSDSHYTTAPNLKVQV